MLLNRDEDPRSRLKDGMPGKVGLHSCRCEPDDSTGEDRIAGRG